MQVLEYDVRWGRIEVLTHAWRFLCSCFFLNHAKCTDPPMLLDGTERPLLPKWWYILRIAFYSSSRSHQIKDLLVVVVLKIPPSFTALSACYRFDLPWYLSLSVNSQVGCQWIWCPAVLAWVIKNAKIALNSHERGNRVHFSLLGVHNEGGTRSIDFWHS